MNPSTNGKIGGLDSLGFFKGLLVWWYPWNSPNPPGPQTTGHLPLVESDWITFHSGQAAPENHGKQAVVKGGRSG